MDGADSDGSEDYFLAAECLQPMGPRRVAESVEKSRPPPTMPGVTAEEGRGSGSPALGQDLGRSEDGGNKSAKSRRQRVRYNSETIKDSPLINHALHSMNTLHVLWANEKLCDVTVVAEGVAFPAHSVVLATHSDYFLRLLLKEEQTGGATKPCTVSLGSLVSAPGFGRILGYMYTSEIELTWGTVCDTLQAACALSVTRVVQIGREFLQSYNIENCLSAMYVAEHARLTSLFDSIHKFVLENFSAVSRTKGFLQCPAEMVARLLADDNVNVPSELDVFAAAKTWIHGNGEAGVKSAPIVMRRVRFQHIPTEDLARYVETDETLMQIPEVRSKVVAVHCMRSSLATGSSEPTGSASSGRPTGGVDNAPIPSPLPTGEEFQMPLRNAAIEILKEAGIIDQSTSSSPLSTPPKSFQPISDRHATESSRQPQTAANDHTAWSKPIQNHDVGKLKEARIITNQSTVSSQPSAPPESSQPISDRDVKESSRQPQTATLNSTAWSTPLHSEADKSKKASIITQSPASHQQSTPPRSFRPISDTLVTKSSPQSYVTTTSPAPWPMPTVQDEQTSRTPTSPRKFARTFHAPRLTSDYRITASNPKSLTSGPIAWPVTKRLERKQKPDVIVTVGGVAKSGESEVAGRMIEAFLLDKNEWRELERMPNARNHHVVHFLNGFLYVIGGSDPHAEGDDFLKPVSSVLKYDVRAGRWSEAQPMNAARIFHEVTALFGQLYAVGGQDQAGRTLATVECYSPTTDRWRYVAPLPSPRYGVAVTVYRGRLWVAGGFPEEFADTSTVPREVVCYNPFCDEWNSMTPLRVPRCHTSLLEMANKLYMIGGFVGDSNTSDEKGQPMSTIEKYNERSEAWEFVADLWQGRHDANTVSVGDKAYIIGGMEDENEDPLPNVECFDPVAMSWAKGLAALSSACFGHACCVVPGDVPIKWPRS